MIRITDISLPLGYTAADIKSAASRRLKTDIAEIKSAALVRRSVDARRKTNIQFIVTADVEVENEKRVLAHVRDSRVQIAAPRDYLLPAAGKLSHRPVVVGFGPAGLFSALLLSRAGLCPLVVERGEPVEKRQQAVDKFFAARSLNTESNVQFGEGGAGTFSDGKLNTGVKDARIFFVLRELAAHGAPEEILFDAKPHVGTDRLPQTVRAIREEILKNGGEIRFSTKLCDIEITGGAVRAVVLEQGGKTERVETNHVVLAIGHSARDTFEMLLEKAVIPMEPKPFSVGARIEHPRELIDRAQYGDFAGNTQLGAADYKLSTHLSNGRGVYTFCMCPGGTVIGAASEAGGVVTNGMSTFRRDAENSNAALLVGVSPADFGSAHPLAGVEFQRKIERAAFEAGGGDYSAPYQRVGDFLEKRATASFGVVRPSYLPGVVPGDLTAVLPDFVTDSMREGLVQMARRLRGFDAPDALLTAPETRSSSPVRILRGETTECAAVRGLFPAGEGAGYAGGITSAAVDGMRCAEEILRQSREN